MYLKSAIELNLILNILTYGIKNNKNKKPKAHLQDNTYWSPLNRLYWILVWILGSLWSLVNGMSLHRTKYQRVKCQLQEYFKSPCQWAGSCHMNFWKDKYKKKAFKRKLLCSHYAKKEQITYKSLSADISPAGFSRKG